MTEPRRAVEVGGQTADKVTGFKARTVENPRKHARGRRLSVGAGDAENPPACKHLLTEPLRCGGVRQTLIPNVLDGWMAARHPCVADDNEIRRRAKECRIKTFEHADTSIGQHLAHRRIDSLIRAGDVVALRFGKHGEGPHERAADAEKMNVHPPKPQGVRAPFSVCIGAR